MTRLWQPSASPAAIRMRASLNARIRAFFAERGVLEVETPILSRAGNSDPNIESLATRLDGPIAGAPGPRWLRTSPEFAIKRLLSAGIGDCYELGRVFRDGESGTRHAPEFTMLEWYRLCWDHRRLMHEVAELVTTVLAEFGRSLRVQTLSYHDLFEQRFGFDPHRAEIATLRGPLADLRIDPEGLERSDWLDLLMSHRIQPDLPPDTLTLVHDFPAEQCALARLRPGDPPVAERFEAYLGPLELANGFHELADAKEQHARFLADQARRRSRKQPVPDLDTALLAALEHGLPACAGVALGVDRLLMALLETDDIGQCLAFSSARA